MMDLDGVNGGVLMMDLDGVNGGVLMMDLDSVNGGVLMMDLDGVNGVVQHQYKLDQYLWTTLPTNNCDHLTVWKCYM